MDKEQPQKKSPRKSVPPSAKGMHDVYGDEFYRIEGFMEKASEVAVYYGFTPLETPALEHYDLFTSGVGEGTDIVDKEMYEVKTKGGDHLALRPEGTAGVMRAYLENGMGSWPHPVMLYYKGNMYRHERSQKGRFRQFKQFGLESLGSSKSIMDATIIQTTVTILKEVGLKNLTIEVNSIGGPDSRAKYLETLKKYYRRFINEMPLDARDRLVKNPLRLLDSKDPYMIEVNKDAPDPMSSLTAEDRQHFSEVLEYLEQLDVPYRINNHLVRGLDYYSRTVFEIFQENDGDEDENKIALAAGGRYDYLASALGNKKDIPAVGVSIGVERVLMLEETKKLSPKIIKKPKVSFIQLGFEAKLKSFRIVEILRKSKTPMIQTLHKDSLGAQLGLTEKLDIPYAIIFGQKECLEDCVIVRNMKTHSQDTVKIEDLRNYLKKLK